MVSTQKAAAAEPATIAAGSILEHWTLVLPAAGAGLLLVLVYLVADHLLLPALRLRAAKRRGSEAVSSLLDRERYRLSRLWDQVAVYEEHDHPDVGALREVAGLRRLVVEMMERACDGR